MVEFLIHILTHTLTCVIITINVAFRETREPIWYAEIYSKILSTIRMWYSYTVHTHMDGDEMSWTERLPVHVAIVKSYYSLSVFMKKLFDH